ncbi:Gfo/Idh/MocA family protein [Kineococcus glutinatus]|uniref:Gfo/Idh/MocA family protein n=1 Tax=Kineococcus glutinatus TaxID=1070872 RepID=UPI0031E6707C
MRIGLVGYGFGGRWFHAPLIAGGRGTVLAGVVTRSPQRAAQVVAEHPGTPVLRSLAALVAAGVDAVAVSTPAATHTAVTEEVLRLGLPVVCDKPFALDAAAARGTVELAERLGVPLTVYQNRRWDSDLRTVRRVLASGELGEVLRFESAFERWAPDAEPPEAGAGLLRDFGSHLVDQALHLFGPVCSVYAETREVRPGLEDDVLLLLRHVRGVRSHLSGAWRQGAPAPRFRVTGSAGSFVVRAPVDGQEQALLAGRTPAREGERWGVEPEAAWGALHRGGHVRAVPAERGRWDEFYERFAAAVRGTGPVPVDPWDAVATATVLDAARRSAAEGRSVEIDTEVGPEPGEVRR